MGTSHTQSATEMFSPWRLIPTSLTTGLNSPGLPANSSSSIGRAIDTSLPSSITPCSPRDPTAEVLKAPRRLQARPITSKFRPRRCETCTARFFRRHHVRMTITGHDHLHEHWGERYGDGAPAYRMDHVVTGGGGAPIYAYRGEPEVGAYLAAGAAQRVRLEHLMKPGPNVAGDPDPLG